MKVRLVGIYEETRYDIATPKRYVAEQEPLESIEIKYVMARFVNVDEPRSDFAVPYEMIRGAQVSDEFTVFLERVKK